MPTYPPITLQAISPQRPTGALPLLLALGHGERGFGGTRVANNPQQFNAWLDYCLHLAHSPPLSDDFPNQYTYWVIGENQQAIGLVRITPHLKHAFTTIGGHIGYYITPAHRQQGYGTAALRLALQQLRQHGITQAIITIQHDNLASIRIAEKLGGRLQDRQTDQNGICHCRYRLDTPTIPR